MTEKYVIFDVETPNARNDRISSIGIAVMEGGRVVDTYSTLVNPETHFDPFNIRLTGITPSMTWDSPTFPELWRQVGGLMESAVLVAHNAAFDMGVLSKCLRAYEIPCPACLPYACTVRMGRKCFPALPDHKLNTMCGHLGIALDHHRADSDALACAALLIRYMEAGLDVKGYIRSFRM